MPALLTDSICKTFGRRVVLRDIAISVPDQGLVCLLGESGAGKSTLLRIVAGLEQPTRGSISIGGHDVTRVRTNQRNIAFVFQDTDALFPNLSVRENIEFPVVVGGRKPRGGEMSTALNDVMSTLRLHALARRAVSNLSGGEKQRVALARSLVYESSLLLLDEPVSSLDNMTKSEFRILIRRIHSKYECSTLLVTHDEREAQALGTNIAILDRATLVQSGRAGDVVDDPATPRSALLLGGWSLLSDEVSNLKSNVTGLNEKLAVIERARRSSGSTKSRAVVGFREDRLSLAGATPLKGGSVSLTATVTTIHPWYGRKRIIAAIPTLGQEVAAVLDGTAGIAEGQTVVLVANEADVKTWEDEDDNDS